MPSPDAGSLRMCVGSRWSRRPRTGSSTHILAAHLGREAPLELSRSLEPQNSRQRFGHLELPPRLDEAIVDDLGQHLRSAVTEDELRSAGEDGVRHSQRLGREHLPARRPLGVSHGAARAGERGVPAGGSGGAPEPRRLRLLTALLDDRGRRHGREQGEGGKQDETLPEQGGHVAEVWLTDRLRCPVITYQTEVGDVRPEALQGFFVAWPATPSPERQLALLNGSDYVVLARDTETKRVVGFVTAVGDGVLSAYIPLLEVLPEYQQRGIGSELVRRMLELLEDVYMVDLCCDEELVSFYQRFGMGRWVGMGLRNPGALAP